MNNRKLALLARLAGAPQAKAAGILLHQKKGQDVEKGQPLFSLFSETPGELAYAKAFLESENNIIHIKE